MGSHLEPYQNAHELRISSNIRKIHDILNKRQNGWDILSIFKNGSKLVPWYILSPPLPSLHANNIGKGKREGGRYN